MVVLSLFYSSGKILNVIISILKAPTVVKYFIRQIKHFDTSNLADKSTFLAYIKPYLDLFSSLCC